MNVYDNVLENDDNHQYYEIRKDTSNNTYYIHFFDMCKYLGGKITLPSTYNGQSITRIENTSGSQSATAFIMNTNVTGIYFSPKLSNKISSIDSRTFFGATNL